MTTCMAFPARPSIPKTHCPHLARVETHTNYPYRGMSNTASPHPDVPDADCLSRGVPAPFFRRLHT
jgi:hypothetical protein